MPPRQVHAPAARCEVELNAYCRTTANCTITDRSTLYARLDERARPPRWRCFPASALAADQLAYRVGQPFCTRDNRLTLLLASCLERATIQKPTTPVQPPPPARQPNGQTCAVVSSSDTLLHHTFGAEIDAHDEVVRINMAPTAGFEQHVGSRTTIAVSNFPSWTAPFRSKRERWLAELGNSAAISVIVTDAMCAPDEFKCWAATEAVHRQARPPPKEFRFSTAAHTQSTACAKLGEAASACRQLASKQPKLLHRCSVLPDATVADAWRSHLSTMRATAPGGSSHESGSTCSSNAPSTGLLAIQSVLGRCQSVRLFGFGLLPPSRGHYWSPLRWLRGEINTRREHAIVRQLVLDFEQRRSTVNVSIAGL